MAQEAFIIDAVRTPMARGKAGGALSGLDSLLATLQMPAGLPVATVTLGSAAPAQ